MCGVLVAPRLLVCGVWRERWRCCIETSRQTPRVTTDRSPSFSETTTVRHLRWEEDCMGLLSGGGRPRRAVQQAAIFPKPHRRHRLPGRLLVRYAGCYGPASHSRSGTHRVGLGRCELRWDMPAWRRVSGARCMRGRLHGSSKRRRTAKIYDRCGV